MTLWGSMGLCGGSMERSEAQWSVLGLDYALLNFVGLWEALSDVLKLYEAF